MRRAPALFAVLLFISSPAFTFQNTARRISPSHDLMRRLNQHFPLAGVRVERNCRALTEANHVFLGENDPATGQAISQNASPLFLGWYSRCIHEYFELEVSDARFEETDAERMFSAEGLRVLRYSRNGTESLGRTLARLKWDALPEDVQFRIEEQLVHFLIGPGVLKDEAAFINHSIRGVLADPGGESTSQAVFSIILAIMTQDQFLEY